MYRFYTASSSVDVVTRNKLAKHVVTISESSSELANIKIAKEKTAKKKIKKKTFIDNSELIQHAFVRQAFVRKKKQLLVYENSEP